MEMPYTEQSNLFTHVLVYVDKCRGSDIPRTHKTKTCSETML